MRKIEPRDQIIQRLTGLSLMGDGECLGSDWEASTGCGTSATGAGYGYTTGEGWGYGPSHAFGGGMGSGHIKGDGNGYGAGGIEGDGLGSGLDNSKEGGRY